MFAGLTEVYNKTPKMSSRLTLVGLAFPQQAACVKYKNTYFEGARLRGDLYVSTVVSRYYDV